MTIVHNTDSASKYIGLSRSWLEKKRVSGDGPAYIKIGLRRVLYRQSDLDEWLDKHSRRSTSEAA